MFRFPFGTVQELNLDWFLEQWEIFKQEAQTAFDGIDHALDAEIQRVEDAMTDLYAARDAAIAARNDSLSYAQSANSSAIGASQSAQNSAASAVTSANQAASAAQSAGQAAQSVNDAHTEVLQAEAEKYLSQAWATGYRGSAPVAPVDPQYHNNSKYYAEYISRAWANGTNAEGNVPASDPAYHNNAKYWSDIAKGFYEDTLALIESLPADVSEILDLYETLAPLAESEELSGDSVEFDSSFSGAPLKKVEVTIEPVQAGSGDPSPDNIRPISGFTECNVTRTGINLLDVSNAAKTNQNFIFGARTVNAMPDGSLVLPAGTYTIQVSETQNGIYAHDGVTSLGSVYNKSKFTFINPRKQAIKIYLYKTGVTSSYWDTINVWLTVGTTDTEYEPFGEVYPITFPSGTGTVYGGNITINQDGSGELVVTDAEIASYNGETLPSTWISDRDVYTEGTSPTTGAQVVYKLATPLAPIPLTASQITTLKGVNYMLADAGTITVVIGDYIETITANLDNGIPKSILGASVETDYTATANYAVNDFIVINQTLYRVTAIIANGGAITPGTNVVATTICGELTALLNT